MTSLLTRHMAAVATALATALDVAARADVDVAYAHVARDAGVLTLDRRPDADVLLVAMAEAGYDVTPARFGWTYARTDQPSMIVELEGRPEVNPR